MFRFTIRELVLLTLVVALGVAWWIDRRGLTALAKEQSRELRVRGYMLDMVSRDWKGKESFAEHRKMVEELVGQLDEPPP